ncbi:hypothetical protein QR680_005965 [Steinernema hermaphroditum]|uniref:NADH dehydrogenase [ubiquinone] 1 alpha subcomplex subunit 7 n=1 Tax=Steinernema hermaphroditum TaxID=289476 RepID=A0AA39HTY1_9BILA|nr:hypothetical protein QR680_005965 [Steinernema hermaphroditum]
MSGRKIASAAVQNRTQTPFWNWIRNKLLAVDRQKITPPPGLPTADGKAVYHNPLRFPNTQTTRSPDPPALPGGVHHKLADNYYLGRDGRRSVKAPVALYAGEEKGASKYAAIDGTPMEKPAVSANKGPEQNFGLEAPTPGFGYEWKRTISEELSTQQGDGELRRLERFDRYLKA